MKKILYFATILVASNAIAQETKKVTGLKFNKEKYSVTASIGHTKDIPLFSVIGVPNVFSNPIRPWYAIGIEKSYKRKATSRRYYGVELNLHDYKYVDKSFGATIIGGFDKKIYKGIYAGLGMGLGVQKAKRADIVYKFEDGIWKGSVFDGRYQYNRQTLRFAAELGYKFSKRDVSVYAGANAMLIRQPFGDDVPLGLYQTPIKLGFRKGLASKWF